MNQQILLTVCLILLWYKLGEFDEISRHFDLIIFFILITCAFDQVKTTIEKLDLGHYWGLKG